MPASEDRLGLVVGVISDTHNHLYPEVKELLDGVAHIIHAGDVCSPTLLSELRTIAPVTAVRGNCDEGAWTANLPVRAELELGGVRILVGHIGGGVREEAAARAAAWAATQSGSEGAEPVDVVVFGHSHQALMEQKDGVLHLNPGAAGPRRYGRPRTMAFLRISADGAAPTADIVVVDG
jgi:putative phosphoesterase